MKKNFLISCLIFLFAFCVSAKELAIMSFNIHGFGSVNNNFNNAEWTSQIAKVIKKSEASIVLLQEVRLDSKYDIEKLCSSVNREGGKWKAVTTYEYAVCNKALHNAVLYDDSKVSLIYDHAKKLGFYDYFNDQNNDCRKYKFFENRQQVLEFSFPKNSNTSFYVANVHAPGPENPKLNQEKVQLERFYADYKSRKPIILGGDFNLSRIDFRSSAFTDAILDGDSGIFSDFDSLRTTVSTNSKKGIELANGYDHFILKSNGLFKISEQMHHVFSSRPTRAYEKIKIGSRTYKTSEEYRQNISDHLPIMIRLKF